MIRDWELARAKCSHERRCRVCPRMRVEAAHVISRSYDTPDMLGTVIIDPLDIVPLCREHHAAYDARKLDLLPYLSLDEQARAVRHVGIIRALHRTTSTRP